MLFRLQKWPGSAKFLAVLATSILQHARPILLSWEDTHLTENYLTNFGRNSQENLILHQPHSSRGLSSDTFQPQKSAADDTHRIWNALVCIECGHIMWFLPGKQPFSKGDPKTQIPDLDLADCFFFFSESEINSWEGVCIPDLLIFWSYSVLSYKHPYDKGKSKSETELIPS